MSVEINKKKMTEIEYGELVSITLKILNLSPYEITDIVLNNENKRDKLKNFINKYNQMIKNYRTALISYDVDKTLFKQFSDRYKLIDELKKTDFIIAYWIIYLENMNKNHNLSFNLSNDNSNEIENIDKESIKTIIVDLKKIHRELPKIRDKFLGKESDLKELEII